MSWPGLRWLFSLLLTPPASKPDCSLSLSLGYYQDYSCRGSQMSSFCLEALLVSPHLAATPLTTRSLKHWVPFLVASFLLLLCQGLPTAGRPVFLLYSSPHLLLALGVGGHSSRTPPSPWSGAQSTVSSGLAPHRHLAFNLSQKDLVFSVLHLAYLQSLPPAGNREPPLMQRYH